jgi:hypothetical protein
MHYYIPPYFITMYKKSMFTGFGLSGHGQFLPPAYEVKREPAILAQLPQVKAFAHAHLGHVIFCACAMTGSRGKQLFRLCSLRMSAGVYLAAFVLPPLPIKNKQ